MDSDREFFQRLIASGSLAGGESRHTREPGLHGLMLAVLDNAIQSYCGPVGRLRIEAEHWITARDGRSPFSFKTVCEVLGLDPDATRRRLVELRTQALPSSQKRRFRPNGRKRR